MFLMKPNCMKKGERSSFGIQRLGNISLLLLSQQYSATVLAVANLISVHIFISSSVISTEDLIIG